MLPNDITGQRFGRLTVLRQNGRAADRQVVWQCQCDCGEIISAKGGNLRSGNTASCGCWFLEGKEAAWNSWRGMKARCNNPSHISFQHYGGRDITYDPRWEIFAVFHADMGDRPPRTSLDRRDNDGPYAPWNCRWSTKHQQARNRRSHRFS